MPRPTRMFDGSSSTSKFFNTKKFHFFKVILPATIQQKRLGLPKKFIRKFGKKLSGVAVLTVPNGKKWHVELKEVEGQICLENGWQEFVDYYSIGVGHFLVFGYHGSSCIHVLIFDTSATEIEYPCHIMDIEESNQENECQAPSKESESVESLDISPPGPIRAESVKGVSNESDRHQTSRMRHLKPKVKCEAPSMEASDSVEIMVVSPKCQKRKAHSPCQVTQSTESDGYDLALQEESSSYSTRFLRRWPATTLMTQAARAFKSDNPFFLVIMRSTYVNEPFILNVPYDFAMEHFKQDLYLTLLDSEGRSWLVRCFFVKSSAKICGRWRYFVKENRLKEGDVCAFEVVNWHDVEMKVVIYRAGSKVV